MIRIPNSLDPPISKDRFCVDRKVGQSGRHRDETRVSSGMATSDAKGGIGGVAGSWRVARMIQDVQEVGRVTKYAQSTNLKESMPSWQGSAPQA